jgi:uncharacterized protein (UPF0261 family)
MNQKSIVLVGTFDTKGQEFLYVKELFERSSYNVITVDIGTGARGELKFSPNYTCEEVANRAGTKIAKILSMGKRGQELRIMQIMAEGAIRICAELYQAGKLDGIISIGGTQGTNMGTAVMRTLPFGVPKVMLSTIASGDTTPFVGTKDIQMIPSVADIAGLNRITEIGLMKAAGALMGMLSTCELKASEKPLIGVTTLSGTTNCALRFKRCMGEKGYEVAIFSANGTGGRAMEELIEQGMIIGVFDLSTNELVDHLYNGYTDAGPTRLEIAGARGIPQLVCPGNIDHIMYSSLDKIPERFKGQPVHAHGPAIYVLRTQKREMMEVGRVLAEKLNKASGPVAVIIPLDGFSAQDRLAKEVFYNPEANLAFVEVLKQSLLPEIPVKEIKAHVTDMSFAEAAAEMFCELLGDQELN